VLTLINLIIRGDGEIQPKYFDYSKEWFDDVGSKITLTMLIYTFNPHVFYFLLKPLFGCIRFIIKIDDIWQNINSFKKI